MVPARIETRVRELSRIISTELGEGRFGSTAWKKATMEMKTLRRQFGDEVAALNKEAANEYTQRCVAAESQAMEMRAAEAAQPESETM